MQKELTEVTIFQKVLGDYFFQYFFGNSYTHIDVYMNCQIVDVF